MSEEQIKALKDLRKPFPEEHISQLPKPTKAQTEEVKADYKKGIRCEICGAWHHPKVVHLSYVGHAALTSRLLDVDPLWNWEPFAVDDNGSPKLDKDGGMWIKLTVCGLTRLGYGDAEGKTGANATKERIGDALRNAAMRFGAALDLWSKADLSIIPEEEQDKDKTKKDQKPPQNKDAVKDKSPSLPGREILDQWLNFIDAYTKATLDIFLADWDSKVMPVMDKMPENFKAEMWAAKKQVEKFLIEKQGVTK